MHRFGEQIEADLLAHYSVDLLDWYRGTMTARRLWVLVSNLPRESAFGSTLRYDADGTPTVEPLPMIGPDGRVRPPTDLTLIPVAADMRAARDLISGANATPT